MYVYKEFVYAFIDVLWIHMFQISNMCFLWVPSSFILVQILGIGIMACVAIINYKFPAKHSAKVIKTYESERYCYISLQIVSS